MEEQKIVSDDYNDFNDYKDYNNGKEEIEFNDSSTDINVEITGQSGNNPPTILIIEDDNRNIFALSLILKAKGYSSLAATSAQRGMTLLADNPGLRIVLLDMMMPELDGYEAIGLLRQVPGRADLPIIAVTAQAMPGDEEKCLSAGANAYVAKPINMERLLDLLNQYLH